MFVIRSVTKYIKQFSSSRFTSSQTSTKPRLIIRSTSNDIYRNLALEDWFYQHHNFEKSNILYFYRNTPCVVIGRHQNPWTEANVPFLRQNRIKLARRNSGGGTVYHDQGNINISFMTTKEEYNRVKNLQIICDALRQEMDIDVSINKRDDIVVDGDRKISGTAAKLSRTGSYHHCTLLVGVNTTHLHQALNNPDAVVIETNATKSVRSPVENIINRVSDINMDNLIDKIEIAIAQQFSEDVHVLNVDPVEENYEGIDNLTKNYESWDWIFGKSPKFTITIDEETTFTISNGNIQLPGGISERFHQNLIHKLRNSDNIIMMRLAHLIRNIV